MLDSSNRKLRVLHLVLSIGATNTTYNEHCLPMAEKRDLSICTYFGSDITPPETVALFAGNGTLRGFFRALETALNAKRYDAIHAHTPHVAALFLAAMLFKYRRLSPSTVVTVHDSYPDYKLRNKLLFIPVFAGFRRVICCSQASYASLPGFYRWLAGDRLGVVQNGVDIARVDRTARQGSEQPLQTASFTIVAISRLVDVKNPGAVIAAFEGNRDRTSRLIYMGDGPLRESLVEKCRAMHLENQVEFTGLVPREKVFEHLLNADLFISTSRGEGLPISVLEAMACRCPVILSNIPPHMEIANGVDFIPLIDADDVEGFAHEIKRFREMTAAERLAVGQKCRSLVEERFSLSAMHAGYGQVYAEIANKQAPSLSEKLAL